jgi:hypothetical protein
MGRPRTPTNVLDARGAFRKNPARGKARENEPVADDGAGYPPAHFTAEQVSAWSELTENAHAGTLSSADRFAVEMASVLLASFRADPAEFSAAKYQRLQSLLATFGMTPADRSKVAAKAKPKENAFATLFGAKKK